MKIKISNMACGHCRLKIEAELKEAGFTSIDFDMLQDTVELINDEGALREARKAIKLAGYIIDEDYSEEKSFHEVIITGLNSFSEIKEALDQIQASVLHKESNQFTISYIGMSDDIYEILDVFGIEYEKTN